MPDIYGPPINPLRHSPQGFQRGVVGPSGYPAETSSGMADFSAPATVAQSRMAPAARPQMAMAPPPGDDWLQNILSMLKMGGSQKTVARHTAEKLQPAPPRDQATGEPDRSTAY